MKKLKLMPRWTRFIGLTLIVFCIGLFINDAEVVFGEMTFLGTKSESPWMVKVPSLLADENGQTVLFKWEENDISNEILLTLMLIGTYLVAFSKIKEEDEFSYQLRMEAMSQALIWNGLLLLLANWLFYDGIFVYIMIMGLFSYLLIFSIVFAFKIRNYQKDLSYEE